jgi:hypothetical protein
VNQATIYAQDEPQGTIYILTRPNGTTLYHEWPHPLLELEPNAVWLESTTISNTGSGSSYAFTAIIPFSEGRNNIRSIARANWEEARLIHAKVPGLQEQVLPRQRDKLLQDLWAAGRGEGEGDQNDPALGLGERLAKAETLNVES